MELTESIDKGEDKAKPKSETAEDFLPDEGEIFSAHWHIFIPTVVIAVLYLCGLILLYLLGKGDGALARLFTLVLAIGVPLLSVHALLRYNTSRIQIADDHVRYHRGWPSRLPVDLPYALIEKAFVKRGLSGRLFGGGTLVLKLTTGNRISVPDLKDPDTILLRLNSRLDTV